MGGINFSPIYLIYSIKKVILLHQTRVVCRIATQIAEFAVVAKSLPYSIKTYKWLISICISVLV